MPVPLIPLLPPAPSRAQGQAAFNLTADPFIAAMPPMVVSVNTSLAWIAQQVAAVADYRQQAAISAQSSADSAASSAQQVQLAKDQVGLAKDQVALAKAARQGAEAARDSAQNYLAAVGAAAGLPALSGKAGKALVVNDAATGAVWGDPYPAYAGKARMSLQVLPNELGVRWVDVGDRIGDVLVSARSPGSQYIPADGSVYLKSAFTELFQLIGLIGGTKANTWTSLTSGYGTANIVGTATDDSGVWMFLGSDGKLRRSTDDGVTNTVIANVTVSGPVGLIYCGNKTFIALGGSSSACLKSSDGGVTWSLMPAFGSTSVSLFCGASDGQGALVIGGQNGNYSYAYRSVDNGATWTLVTVGGNGYSLQAVAIGRDGKAYAITNSVSVGGGGDTYVTRTLFVSTNYGAAWTQTRLNMSDLSGTSFIASLATDMNGLWLFTLGSRTYRIGDNGNGNALLVTGNGRIATDKNGTWLLGDTVSTNDAIDFASANLAAPVASTAAASRAGTFMVGATSGSLRRSVPTFPYDSASQFAVPNISSPIGVKAYIKAKEAA